MDVEEGCLTTCWYVWAYLEKELDSVVGTFKGIYFEEGCFLPRGRYLGAHLEGEELDALSARSRGISRRKVLDMLPVCWDTS